MSNSEESLTEVSLAIYHIDNRCVEKEIKSQIQEENLQQIENNSFTTDELVNFLIEKNEDYVLQEQKESIKLDIYGYNSKILYKKGLPKFTPWSKCFKNIVVDNSPILQSKKHEESFLNFIYNKDNIFVLTGGYSFHRIESFIDLLFGIKILSGLIDENKKAIKAVSDRNVAQTVMASTRLFRTDFSIKEDIDFGKIYKEILATIDSNILSNKLGLDIRDLKKTNCIAKDYFKITKSLNIFQIYKLISKIEEILKKSKNDLNKVQVLKNRNKRDKELIENLEKQLLDTLYENIYNNNNFTYNICDKNYYNYTYSDKYILKYNSYEMEHDYIDSDIICEYIRNKEGIGDKKDFYKFVSNIRLVSNLDGNENTNSKLFNCINCEIEYSTGKFFYIDGVWFKITNSYIKELNTLLTSNIKGIVDNSMLLKWDASFKTEDDYIKSYESNNSVIISHKKFLNNIEFADLIIYQNNELYLVHIKRGFEGTTRELAYQMEASKKILEDIKNTSNYEFLEELYDKLNINEKNKILKDNFINKFKISIKNIKYVFAFNVENINNYNIENDIDKFKSNISKVVLLDLIKKFRADGIDFKVCQIKR